jgi:hypothetical protein
MPRPKQYASNAERQRAYRERQQLLIDQVEELKAALCGAAERGRSAKRLTNHLPDNPADWIPMLVGRLNATKLVASAADSDATRTERKKAKRAAAEPQPFAVGDWVEVRALKGRRRVAALLEGERVELEGINASGRPYRVTVPGARIKGRTSRPATNASLL